MRCIPCRHCLKEEIMEGGDTFKLASGLHVFEYTNKDKRFNEIQLHNAKPDQHVHE